MPGTRSAPASTTLLLRVRRVFEDTLRRIQAIDPSARLVTFLFQVRKSDVGAYLSLSAGLDRSGGLSEGLVDRRGVPGKVAGRVLGNFGTELVNGRSQIRNDQPPLGAKLVANRAWHLSVPG